VTDVVSALATMLNAPLTSTASTFVLAGPEKFTYNELLNLVSFFTMRPVSNFPTVPKPLAKLFATLVNRGVWWPTVSPDEIERKYIDDIGVNAPALRAAAEQKPSGWEGDKTVKIAGIDGEPVKGWAELGIEPDLMEEHAIKYLRMYRAA
jgi:NADH dehydrogenase (ubiquinone) 1 alpha subcomplex subunit 9